MLAHFAIFEKHFKRRGPALWAIYWHDAVYDPTRKDNEAASAQLLRHEAAGLLSDHDLTLAARMIEATAHHLVPDDLSDDDAADTGLFLDMDLSILGAREAVFDNYERNIRDEYGFVPEDRFRATRAEILKSLLDREVLYFSQIARDKWEAAARGNISRSITRLEGL